MGDGGKRGGEKRRKGENQGRWDEWKRGRGEEVKGRGGKRE